METMKRDSVSPAQESYKKLSQEDRELLGRFGIKGTDMISDSYFNSMIEIMKRIEVLEGK